MSLYKPKYIKEISRAEPHLCQWIGISALTFAHCHTNSNAVWEDVTPCHSLPLLLRSFILVKWISCVIVLSSWAWCCWPHYCCICCCHPSDKAAWNHLLRLREWGCWPHLLQFQPSMCLFAQDSCLETHHCSSERPYPLTGLDDSYCPGEITQAETCTEHFRWWCFQL